LINDSKFSFAPLGDPGNVSIRELFLTPAMGRDMMATGLRQMSRNTVKEVATYMA